MGMQNTKYDIIGFLITGPKSRKDFWSSQDFYVPNIKRGICPYKMLNDLLDIGCIEKISYSYDSQWNYTPTTWKLTEKFKDEQNALESDTVEREKSMDEITLEEINRLRSFGGDIPIKNRISEKITIKIAENRKNIHEMVDIFKKLHDEGVNNE
jgi:hypothetical protein